MAYFPTIDGWRTIAILLVIVAHFEKLWDRVPITIPWEKALHTLASRGTSGVELFFAISGFLITSRLIRDMEEWGKVSYSVFYVRRFFRIFPPILPFFLVSFVLANLGLVYFTSTEFWSSLFFYRNFISGSWLTGHFWSLSVEEHFYLIWPLLFSFVFPQKKRIALTSLLLFLGIWRETALALGWSGVYRTDVCLFSLLAGGVVSILLHEGTWKRLIVPKLTGRMQLFLAGNLLLALWAQNPLRFIQYPIAAALLIPSFMHSPHSKIYQLLESAPMRWLGKRSYGIYIWQQLFTVPLANQQAPTVWELSLRFALLLLVAALSYEFLETPLVKFGYRIAERLAPKKVENLSSLAA